MYGSILGHMRKNHPTLTDLVPLNSREIGAIWAQSHGISPIDAALEDAWKAERAERPTLRLTPLDLLDVRAA